MVSQRAGQDAKLFCKFGYDLIGNWIESSLPALVVHAQPSIVYHLQQH